MYRVLLLSIVMALISLQCKNEGTNSVNQQVAKEVVSTTEKAKSDVKTNHLEGPKKTASTSPDNSKLLEPKPIVDKPKESSRQVAPKVSSKPKPAPKPVGVSESSKKVSPPNVSAQKPQIAFNRTTFEFGEIDEGEKVSHDFKFVNTGKTPLVIEDVAVSCGCTVPSYPIMPIEPGATGSIGVLFNSKGKFGTQKPYITVKSNATTPIVKLFMSGSIKHVFEKPTTAKDSTKVEQGGKR